MIPWLLKNPALSAALGALIAALAWGGVQTVRLSGSQADGARAGLAVAEGAAELAELRADIAEQRERFERESRAAEQRQRDALYNVAADFEQELYDAQTRFDLTIADLHAGSLRLQRRFQCPPGAAAGNAEAAAGGPVDHEAAQSGFTREDAAVALRIAADGDAAIVQLGACQSAIRVMQGIGQ